MIPSSSPCGKGGLRSESREAGQTSLLNRELNSGRVAGLERSPARLDHDCAVQPGGCCSRRGLFRLETAPRRSLLEHEAQDCNCTDGVRHQLVRRSDEVLADYLPVRCRQLLGAKLKCQLANLAVEAERDLVVVVVDGRAQVRSDVE